MGTIASDKVFAYVCAMSDSTKSIFFTSDHHFGVPSRAESLERERLFVQWLENIAPRLEALYIMGDLFDFWFEYKRVIPKGYALLMGALARITEAGIPVHYYRGNHDIWAFNYFEQELGFVMHRQPEIVYLKGKKFFLAHGDGLGPGDRGYKFLKKVFENPVNQFLFRQIHPDLGIRLALFWSGQSRYANVEREKKEKAEGKYENSEWLLKEALPVYARSILNENPDIDYFVFGHWHLPVELRLSPTCTYYNVGDWLWHFSWLEFNGNEILRGKYDPLKKGF